MPNTPDEIDLDVEVIDDELEVVDLSGLADAYTVVMDDAARTFTVEGVEGAAADTQIAVKRASRAPSKTAVVYPRAEHQMKPEALRNVLRRTPLFEHLGMQTMEALYRGASLLVVPENADIISNGSEAEGLVIPTQPTFVELFKGHQSLGELELGLHSFLGEFMMALNRRPTARVANRSSEREFVHIPHALFAGLDPRAREEIELEILRKSALVANYGRRDVALDRGDSMAEEGYVLCEARASVPKILSTLRPFADTGTDHFKSHYVSEYGMGDKIEPKSTRHLGLILQGMVAVNWFRTDPMEFAKLSEIMPGNVIFEANAAGREAPDDLQLIAVEAPTRVLWIYLAPDDPNYDQLRYLALHGMADKLELSNERASAILMRDEE